MEIKIKRLVRKDGRVSIMDSGGNWYSTFVANASWDTHPEKREILNTAQEGEIVEISTAPYTSQKTGKSGMNITDIVRVQYREVGTDEKPYVCGPPLPPSGQIDGEDAKDRRTAVIAACDAYAGRPDLTPSKIRELARLNYAFLRTGVWPDTKEEETEDVLF